MMIAQQKGDRGSMVKKQEGERQNYMMTNACSHIRYYRHFISMQCKIKTSHLKHTAIPVAHKQTFLCVYILYIYKNIIPITLNNERDTSWPSKSQRSTAGEPAADEMVCNMIAVKHAKPILKNA